MQLVTPLPAASCPSLSLKHFYFPYRSLCFLISETFPSPPTSLSIAGLVRVGVNQDFPHIPEELLGPLMLSPTLLAAHFVVLRPSFSFRQAQFVQVFQLNPVPVCKLSATPTSLPHIFSPQTLALSLKQCSLLRVSFYLKPSDTSGKSCLPSFSVLSGYNGSLDTVFSKKQCR